MNVIKFITFVVTIFIIEIVYAQDIIVNLSKDTIYGRVVDLSSFGVKYERADGKTKTVSNWVLKSIVFENQNDVIVLKRGKQFSGHVIKIDNQRAYLGISGKNLPKPIYLTSIKSINYADGSIDSIPPFIKNREINQDVIEEEEKIEKQALDEEKFIKYSTIDEGKFRFLIGYNLLNEVHIGVGKNLANNRSIELQVGYVFPIRDKLIYDPAVFFIKNLYNVLSRRQIQEGIATRLVYSFSGSKEKTSEKVERTLILEYSYLESGDFVVVQPTGYHSSEPGYIYHTTSNNIAFIFGLNRYFSKRFAYYFNLGFSLDFENVYYTYKGVINTISGNPIPEQNPENPYINYSTTGITGFPFFRVGINFYLSK